MKVIDFPLSPLTASTKLLVQHQTLYKKCTETENSKLDCVTEFHCEGQIVKKVRLATE